MVDDNLRGGVYVPPLLTWIFGAALSVACLFWFRSFFPPPSNDTFIASFFIFSALLLISLFGIGNFVCSTIFKMAGTMMDLPVGVGTLALFLTFYLRTSLNPIAPLGLLFLGGAHSLRLACHGKKNLVLQLNNHTTAVITTICVICMITLSFTTIGDGFLLFPNDFDSNLIHVTGPRIIVEHGHFFNPTWLRGLWLPQLTMVLYTFILTFSDQIFLKTLNVVCFVQLALLFANTGSTPAGRLVALACFAALNALPEFRQYIVQTNLDTIFALFTVSAFFLLLKHLREPTLSSLLLLALMCGLSAGQKHFGLMYSAPVLTVASLRYLLQSGNMRFWPRRALHVAGTGTIFVVILSCFYLHNVWAGNALLFPFIGTKVNTYGWDQIDLTQMIESTIPHWGHSKTLLGYFLLPSHLIQHPDKYQFHLFGSWTDWGMSVAIGSLYLATVASLVFRPLRRVEIIVPCLVLCADIFFWYRGSQVIRYLFPLLISSALLGAEILQLGLGPLNSNTVVRRGAACIATFIAVTLAGLWIVPPQTPLAQSEEEARAWLTSYRGSKLGAFTWLSEHASAGQEILNLAGHGEMAQFPRLRMCGDWFGRCRYSRFIDGYIRFREWPELQASIKANQLSYIVVNWNSFAPHSKLPTTPDEWKRAIPESTRNCIEHMYNDGVSTDVYKVKEACLL